MSRETETIETLFTRLDNWARAINEGFNAFIADHHLVPLLEEDHISVSGSVESFRQALSQIYQNWDGDAAQPALEATTALLAVDAQLGLFNAAFAARFKRVMQAGRKVRTAVQKAWKKLKKKLRALLNALQSGLKSLLSRLPHLKEWSLAGDSGVHAFGLTSTITLELTFGPLQPAASGGSGQGAGTP